MIKDRNNNVIDIGDRFNYQADTFHEYVGKIVDNDGIPTIEWEDETESIPLGDFWYRTDSKLTEKI